MIYLVAVETGPRVGTCKIGFSSAPGRRAAGLAFHVKGKVTLLAVAPGTRDDERRLHNALASARVAFGTEREYFRRDAAEAAFNAERGASPVGLSVALGDRIDRDALFSLDTDAERAKCIARGKVIRALRIAAGLSIRDVAAAVGVSVGAVQKWEGGTDPGVFSALRLCDVLGVPFDSIWRAAPEDAS